MCNNIDLIYFLIYGNNLHSIINKNLKESSAIKENDHCENVNW